MEPKEKPPNEGAVEAVVVVEGAEVVDGAVVDGAVEPKEKPVVLIEDGAVVVVAVEVVPEGVEPKPKENPDRLLVGAAEVDGVFNRRTLIDFWRAFPDDPFPSSRPSIGPDLSNSPMASPSNHFISLQSKTN